MRVRFTKQFTIQAVGPAGPHKRVFEIGDVVELPDMHAQLVVARGDAQLAGDDEKPAVKKSAAKKPAGK